MLAIGFAVKARIQIKRRAFDLDPRLSGDIFEVFQGVGQQDRIGLVDWRDGQWRQDVALIFGNRDDLFPRLVFVTAVADSIAPFLATVFEPSP